MKNVGLDNKVAGCDFIELSYNHESRLFDHLIGAVMRDGNHFIVGTIVDIDYSRDSYQHDNVFAILDNGKRINCRRFI
jgi:hypothetical protein